MKDELIGRFVLVGKQPGTVTEIVPAVPAKDKKPAVPEMLKVKLQNVPTERRDGNVIVEVERNSNEWRLKYPERKPT